MTYLDYLLRALEKGPADVPTLASRTNSGRHTVTQGLKTLSGKVKLLDSGRYALRSWQAGEAQAVALSAPVPEPADAPADIKLLATSPAAKRARPIPPRFPAVAKAVDPCKEIARHLINAGPQPYRDIVEATGYPYTKILQAHDRGLIKFDFPNKLYHV